MRGQQQQQQQQQQNLVHHKIETALKKPISQSCAVAKSEKFWWATGQQRHGLQHQKVWFFRTHTTALWPIEQYSTLSAKFDRPVACRSLSLLATAHDCETGL